MITTTKKKTIICIINKSNKRISRMVGWLDGERTNERRVLFIRQPKIKRNFVLCLVRRPPPTTTKRKKEITQKNTAKKHSHALVIRRLMGINYSHQFIYRCMVMMSTMMMMLLLFSIFVFFSLLDLRATDQSNRSRS